jgi:aryl-alcohol dehydrogenase-like predicted oxidoreductase
MTKETMTRREASRLIGAGAAGLLLPIGTGRAQAKSNPSPMLMRAIPSSGEKLPVIGLGTARVFEVDLTPQNEKPLSDVLANFSRLGGRVVDTSPMYGQAEEVTGHLVSKLGIRNSLFLATKVWIRGRQEGIDSMERSFARLQTKRIDLMQVHNLVDTATQLATMRAWKKQGRFRYIGITHSRSSAFPEVEKILRSEKLDFLQINYSMMEPEADQRILPLAQERGVAVMINRPFGNGALFARVRSRQLPEWASEFDCRSWAQFFLKWIVANPAVTCTIPATNNVAHLQDDLEGGRGRLPDAKTRQRMAEFIGAL